MNRLSLKVFHQQPNTAVMKAFKERKSCFFIHTLLIGLLAISFTACDDDDDETVEPASVAYVSLYHASPDTPPFDVLMENRQINYYPLQYGRYTGYLNFFAGERSMRVRPASDANVIIDTTFTFEEDAAYSLFYVNQLSDIMAFLVNDNFEIPTAGNSAVRFIHLSPDAPPVEVVRFTDDANTNTVFADNRAYLDVTDFTTVASGQQSYQVRIEGTEDVLLSVPDINLLSGRVYTIVVRGFNTPPSGNTSNLGVEILVNY
jgi:hypothetical protein